ncbi:MAG: hypothetical protein K1X51_03465 [Rhodospirillaceae bacterium]|nr:hypothetical protein [Rhodospirillaceae bacterium]
MLKGHITLIAAVLLATSAYGQQSLPKSGGDPLMEICSGFLQQGQGVSGDQAKLCTCLVRETKGRLTQAELQAYNQATASGQQPPPAVMQKVIGIATACLTEAQK